MSSRREHPVLWGLVALVAVATFLGLVLGVGALAVSRMAGLGGGGSDSAGGGGDSLYLPSRSASASAETSGSAEGGGDKPRKPRRSEKPETAITLTAGQTSVSPMGQIDLTGSYPGGDGAILQVQRFEGGRWVSFPVTMSVSGDTFSTYVQTGQGGANKFRVADTGAGQFSNPVTVTVG